MTQPDAYTRQFDFTDFQDDLPTRPLPATQVDAEFDAVKHALDETQERLERIQRDDGGLRNGSVTTDSLSSALKALVAIKGGTVRGAWAMATSYGLKDIVETGGGAFLCAVAHTSGVFATDYGAGKWVLIGGGGAEGIGFTPAGELAAETVQAAIEELDAEKQPLSATLTTLASIGSPGIPRIGTAGGTANAVTIALADALDAPTLGVTVRAFIASDNTDLTTLAVGGHTAWAVYKTTKRGLVRCTGYELRAGMLAEFVSNGADKWVLLNPADSVATGELYMHHGLASTLPGSYLALAGGTVGSASSAAVYAGEKYRALYGWYWNNFEDAECAVSSGRGASAADDFDANKTLTIRDMRGRVAAGLDTVGGAAGRLTNAVSGVDATKPGKSGGVQTVTLTEDQMPGHTHSITDPGHLHSYQVSGSNNLAVDIDAADTTANQGLAGASTGGANTGINGTNSTGGGQAHNNTQPTEVAGVWAVGI